MEIWQIILMQGLILAGIIVILRLLFNQQLSLALKRLQEIQKQNLEKEVALNKELERAIQYRQQEVAKGKEEADKLKAHAKEEADKLKIQILAQAKQETNTLLSEAKQESEHLKREAVSQAEETSVGLAIGIIKELFSEKTKHAFEKELVDGLIQDLDKVDKAKIKVDVKKAQVITAHPILENQKNTIKEKLQNALGSHIEVEEKIDESIISGIIINLGGLVLDGSVSNKIHKLIPYLRKQ